MSLRKIIHVDMDAFYASIEQRDHPEYRNRPLAVGYAFERGVVAAASYEARVFGVRSAMPSVTAQQRCPGLIFVPARFDLYKEISYQIRDILKEFTDLVEPLSLDEAYLDVTDNKFGVGSATVIAGELKARIRKATGLTASAGVSVNKFLAKIASDYDKPDGLYVIPPDSVPSFVQRLEIEKFWGVGKVTAQKMRELGIHTGADLQKYSLDELTAIFGKAGISYYQNARGIDDRLVMPDRPRKSIGAEQTFLSDIADMAKLKGHLNEIADDVWRRLAVHSTSGRTVTLKVKYADFEQITRRSTLSAPIRDRKALLEIATRLLTTIDIDKKSVRLLGISVSSFDEGQGRYRQRELGFTD